MRRLEPLQAPWTRELLIAHGNGWTAYLNNDLDGGDHGSHAEQASMIRRYIAWRNQNAHDQRLREIVNRANVA